MRESTLKQFAWQLVGLLFYLAGMVFFLIIVISVFVNEPDDPVAALAGDHLPLLLMSMVLILLGRVISWKFGTGLNVGAFGSGNFQSPGVGPGTNDRPDETVLEQHGYYHSPRETDDDEDDGIPPYEPEKSGIRCESCGTTNDPEYDYCGNCAAELPK